MPAELADVSLMAVATHQVLPVVGGNPVQALATVLRATNGEHRVAAHPDEALAAVHRAPLHPRTLGDMHGGRDHMCGPDQARQEGSCTGGACCGGNNRRQCALKDSSAVCPTSTAAARNFQDKVGTSALAPMDTSCTNKGPAAINMNKTTK